MREASRDPRAAFVFEGVEGPVVGEYGLAGGGAAGLELDATNHALGTPAAYACTCFLRAPFRSLPDDA